MLVLTRRPGAKTIIEVDGQQVVVTVLSVQGGKVRLGVEAPKEIKVLREELCER